MCSTSGILPYCAGAKKGTVLIGTRDSNVRGKKLSLPRSEPTDPRDECVLDRMDVLFEWTHEYLRHIFSLSSYDMLTEKISRKQRAYGYRSANLKKSI